MGFLGKGDKEARRRSATTVVAAGTRFNGELTVDAKLHVDGNVQGTVASSGDIAIGHTGRVEATVKAERMVVSGYFKGRIECTTLEIVEGGTVVGEVLCENFVVDSGGQFEGERKIRPGPAKPALTYNGAKAAQKPLEAAKLKAQEERKRPTPAQPDAAPDLSGSRVL